MAEAAVAATELADETWTGSGCGAGPGFDPAVIESVAVRSWRMSRTFQLERPRRVERPLIAFARFSWNVPPPSGAR